MKLVSKTVGKLVSKTVGKLLSIFNFYVVTNNSSRLLKHDVDGNEEFSVGTVTVTVSVCVSDLEFIYIGRFTALPRLRKYDFSDGSFIAEWDWQGGNSVRVIVTDLRGDLFAGGSPNNNIVIEKFTPDGDSLFTMALTGSTVFGLSSDRNNDLVAGASITTNNRMQKYTNQGDLIWSSNLGWTPRSISTDIDLDIYLVHIFSDNALRKYDSDGNFVWVVNNTGPQYGVSSRVDIDGNIEVTSGGDYFNGINVRKVDGDGDFIWAVSFNPDVTVRAVDFDHKGDIIVGHTVGNDTNLTKLDGETGDVIWEILSHTSTTTDVKAA